MILDAHVHLRDWSQAYQETVFHAFWLAGRLGVAGLIEMPNTKPPLTSRAAVERRLKLVAAAIRRLAAEGYKAPHYAMHLGLLSQAQQIRAAVALHREFFPKIAGFKMYAGHSTGEMGIVAQTAQHQVYATLAAEHYDGVLVVHCEAQDLIDDSRFEPLWPQSHSAARPVEAELRSIAQQLDLAAHTGFGGHLHIAHISTPEGVEMVGAAKQSGRRVSCGATPQHCLLSLAWQEKLGGNLLKVNPPLRVEECRRRLWQLLLEGKIDWIESDHAPHAPAEKQGTGPIASGIPGLSGIHLLYSRLKSAGLATTQLSALRYANALATYQLPWPQEDFAAEPPTVDLPNLREADGGPLYQGLDPYPQLCSKPTL